MKKQINHPSFTWLAGRQVSQKDIRPRWIRTQLRLGGFFSVALLLSVPLLLGGVRGECQNIAINTTGNPANSSAGLDVDFTNKGILFPRVALTATNSGNPISPAPGIPEEGLVVYNTATAGAAPNDVAPGYYYWDGAKWVTMSSSSSSIGNAITGPVNVCLYQLGVAYSVCPITGAAYTWYVPVGATIASGQGTNAVTVDFGSSLPSTSFISVVIAGSCATGTQGTLVLPVASCPSVTFNWTGAAQNWTVPADVTYAIIDAYGAQGETFSFTGTSGSGGRALKTISVTPGEVLKIYVGRSGGTPTHGTGGWNGGGNGGVSGPGNSAGDGGGGASDVRRTPYALADRLVVAGGGGGGGARTSGPAGGGGGGLVGVAGVNGTGNGGGGGTQAAGGSLGACTACGTSGTAGGSVTQDRGGNGGTAATYFGGGGGGGGYYGGGGGSGSDANALGGGGGGGGSSWCLGGCDITTSGVQTGNGGVTIYYGY